MYVHTRVVAINIPSSVIAGGGMPEASAGFAAAVVARVTLAFGAEGCGSTAAATTG